jgi:hypothetical protein
MTHHTITIIRSNNDLLSINSVTGAALNCYFVACGPDHKK